MGNIVKGLIVALSIALAITSVLLLNSYQKRITEGKEYFKSIKLQKKADDNQAMHNLITIMDDENVSPESRHKTAEALRKILSNTYKEREIEERLYEKFGKEVVCFIEERRCRIILRKRDISKSEAEYIKDIVYKVSGLSNFEVELRW